MASVKATLLVIALALAGTAIASGSFSAKLDVFALELEANIEQEITTVGPWTFYAGSGFAITRTGIEKLQPYTMACTSLDAGLAYAEFCTELRAPIIGPGSILRSFLTIAW